MRAFAVQHIIQLHSQIKVADKRQCEVSLVGICQVPLRGGRCVLCVCIWWWRHCSRPLPSPTIMCWSGLTQWALWRLIWRWWGWRACLSSWSMHRSFTDNQENRKLWRLKFVSWPVNVPKAARAQTQRHRMLHPNVSKRSMTFSVRQIYQGADRWGGEGGLVQRSQNRFHWGLFWQHCFLM